MGTIAKPPLGKITAIQLLVALSVSGVVIAIGKVESYSLLIGCLIQVAGSAYFARLTFRYQGARQLKAMVQSMYLGQSGKILLTAVMFASVFILVKPLNVLLVFVGYIFMLILHASLVTKLLK